jgi:hypothetical protein
MRNNSELPVFFSLFFFLLLNGCINLENHTPQEFPWNNSLPNPSALGTESIADSEDLQIVVESLGSPEHRFLLGIDSTLVCCLNPSIHVNQSWHDMNNTSPKIWAYGLTNKCQVGE